MKLVLSQVGVRIELGLLSSHYNFIAKFYNVAEHRKKRSTEKEVKFGIRLKAYLCVE